MAPIHIPTQPPTHLVQPAAELRLSSSSFHLAPRSFILASFTLLPPQLLFCLYPFSLFALRLRQDAAADPNDPLRLSWSREWWQSPLSTDSAIRLCQMLTTQVVTPWTRWGREDEERKMANVKFDWIKIKQSDWGEAEKRWMAVSGYLLIGKNLWHHILNTHTQHFIRY